MRSNESGKLVIEVFKDGMEIVFRFYGYSDEEISTLAQDVDFMQDLMDQCNENGDFAVEAERTLH